MATGEITCPNTDQIVGTLQNNRFRCSINGGNQAEFWLTTHSSMCQGCPIRRQVVTQEATSTTTPTLTGWAARVAASREGGGVNAPK